MNRSAFTLIEMLVVISLIAFVASVVVPKGFGMIHSIERFIQKKRSYLELEHSQMIAFSTSRSALIEKQTIFWDDNTSQPFFYPFTGSITSQGITVPR